MCGIAGIISTKRGSAAIIESMTSALSHRGPDSHGTWIDLDNNIYFGHQRLSIVDLSSAGNQPMHSACDRYCIIYNGEIYNTNANSTNDTSIKVLKSRADAANVPFEFIGTEFVIYEEESDQLQDDAGFLNDGFESDEVTEADAIFINQ
ncbi:MAG: hypothetical protein IIB73_12725 [Proteobacteria bacterium]|nr:hypothetical protein [Pseudomonadota bacterium]